MPKVPTYSPNRVQTALREIQTGAGSLRSIAQKYCIPRATLQFKIKNPGHKNTFGPSPILSEDEENTIVKWITKLAQKGFPRKPDDIISSIQQFIKEHPRPNPFNNDKPGPGWMKAFLRRHPKIVTRSPKAVTSASACLSEKDIRKWFSDIEEYIKETHLEDVLEDPSRLFNGDETGFQICPQTGKVLAPKGCKNVYTIDRGSAKENITVMFTFSANGKTCCPMIVFPYQRIPEKIAASVPAGWGIGRSDNGWMTAHTFYEYIANVFHPYLIQQGVKLPIILFIDGHKSHLTYHLSVLCSQIGIELIALYPNATRILQPADVAVFRPIKIGWQKAVRQWHSDHPGEAITKLTFSPILHEVVTNCVKRQTLENGFKACGLYPFDANSVDYSKCLSGSQNEATVQINTTSNSHTTMTYSSFVKIVGEEKVELFKKIHDMVDRFEDDNFFILYKLWKHYNGDGLSDDGAASSSSTTAENSLQQKPAENEDDGDISFQPTEPQSVNSDTSDKQAENFSEVMNDGPVSDNIPENVLDVQPNTSKGSSSVIQIQRNSNISDYLSYPESPKRKGKRQTERLPFAIASQKYQDMLKEKTIIKLAAEKEKVRKKKEREEARAAKVQNKSLKKTKTPSGKCMICTRPKSNIICGGCKSMYHKKCIPRSHQEHIPEENDGDLFLCHKCYCVGDETSEWSEDMDSVHADDLTNDSQEDNNFDDAQTTRLQETQEIDALYQYYLDNKDK